MHNKDERIYPKSSRLDQLARMWKENGSRPTYIEPATEGEESVWDYPRPPYIEKSTSLFKASYNDHQFLNIDQAIKIAETASPPTYYFKQENLQLNLIKEQQKSHCEWKGEATYYSFELNGEVLRSIAWSYEEPSAEYEILKGLIGFYPAPFDVSINEFPVSAQPGLFYGGWVTQNIKGPIKGEPGSQGW